MAVSGTDITGKAPAKFNKGLIGWAIAISLFVLFWNFGQSFVEWAFKYPKGSVVPVAKWISQFTKWLIN